MKRYYIDGITDLDKIEAAIFESSRHKLYRKSVQKILANPKYYALQIQKMLEEESFKPTANKPFIIIDGVSKKERKIDSAPFYPDQIIHTLLITKLKPYFKKGMYEFSCACVPGRGTHYGKKYVERWIKNDSYNTKYFLKLDIQKYYPSLKPKIINKLLDKHFKNCKTIRILKIIINKYQSLPIGLLTSQWLANFCLQGLDHFIKEGLKIPYYVRYLDDMILFDSNKKRLHFSRREIDLFLKLKLGLRLKHNWQLNKFDFDAHRYGNRNGQVLDFMGFQFFRHKTIIRKSIFLRLKRKLLKVSKQRYMNIRDVKGLLSYYGWVKHTNNFRFYHDNFRYNLRIKNLRKMVSNYDWNIQHQTA